MGEEGYFAGSALVRYCNSEIKSTLVFMQQFRSTVRAGAVILVHKSAGSLWPRGTLGRSTERPGPCRKYCEEKEGKATGDGC